MVFKRNKRNISLIEVDVSVLKKLGQLKYLWAVKTFNDVIKKLLGITTKMQNAGELEC